MQSRSRSSSVPCSVLLCATALRAAPDEPPADAVYLGGRTFTAGPKKPWGDAFETESLVELKSFTTGKTPGAPLRRSDVLVRLLGGALRRDVVAVGVQSESCGVPLAVELARVLIAGGL
jgi:hypothetical protein